MLTPATINVQPRGWLDFFGMKNGGRGPQDLSAVIAPTMDMLPWYAQGAENFHAQQTIVGTGVANWSPQFLPEVDEVWLVWAMAFSMSIGAAQRWTGMVILDQLGGNMELSLSEAIDWNGAALGAVTLLGRRIEAITPTTPLIINRAHEVRIRTAGLTGAGFNLELDALFTRVKA